MRYRATFLVGFAVGYVLGARAGRERYEQIARTARRVVDSPAVQETAGVVRARAEELATTARVAARDKVGVPLQEKLHIPRRAPHGDGQTATTATSSTPPDRPGP